MAFVTLLALFCFAAIVRSGAAMDTTINANVYATDSANIDVKNVTSILAGQTFVLNFLLTDQASNATIGELLGYCVVLTSQGPSQCQFTAQLASGTIQVRHTCLSCLGSLFELGADTTYEITVPDHVAMFLVCRLELPTKRAIPQPVFTCAVFHHRR